MLNSQFLQLRQAAQRQRYPDLATRLQWLGAIDALLLRHGDDFTRAIAQDFGHRSPHETRLADIMPLRDALRHTQRHLARWMRTQTVPTSLTFQPGRCLVMPQPQGVVGVISPWNYPLILALEPAMEALAAGNRVMIKPSELTPRFSALLAQTVAQAFPADVLSVAIGGVEVAQAFTALPWDHLFFTGSTRVGREVAKAAAANLTPVTLELGGKSPTIISASADLERAAGSLVMAKALNAGQTCIAPDYVFVHEHHRSAFSSAFSRALQQQYPALGDTPDYSSLITDHHFDRQLAMLDDARAHGATIIAPNWAPTLPDRSRRRMAPTLILNATESMRVMQEEIFGPLLPVIFYEDTEAIINYIGQHERPLALYWFGRSDQEEQRILRETIAGGVTINDCILHIAQNNLPFGGVGASGYGTYHGEWGFKNFSKLKPIFRQSRWSGAHLMRAPYGKMFDWLSRAIGGPGAP